MLRDETGHCRVEICSAKRVYTVQLLFMSFLIRLKKITINSNKIG